jgi:hypothetical protein
MEKEIDLDSIERDSFWISCGVRAALSDKYRFKRRTIREDANESSKNGTAVSSPVLYGPGVVCEQECLQIVVNPVDPSAGSPAGMGMSMGAKGWSRAEGVPHMQRGDGLDGSSYMTPGDQLYYFITSADQRRTLLDIKQMEGAIYVDYGDRDAGTDTSSEGTVTRSVNNVCVGNKTSAAADSSCYRLTLAGGNVFSLPTWRFCGIDIGSSSVVDFCVRDWVTCEVKLYRKIFFSFFCS